MRWRRAYCLEKSIEHRSKLFVITFHGKHDPLPPEVEEMWRRRSPHAAWHLAASDVYLGCASHPWRLVPPEPPKPVDFPAGQAPSR
ncbi:hypothetical protein [Singulisphaera sp. GP187]|uniref:hypothetical protein n=1 Tax=Singulisphaera sp. GP187 TaxID=1882752 RepID=UPI00116147FF|nr:hypothetical protein [Singulisphaera sp. GP187]